MKCIKCNGDMIKIKTEKHPMIKRIYYECQSCKHKIVRMFKLED